MFRKKKDNPIKKDKPTSKKWRVLEGSTCDDTIMTNGERNITWDEWFQKYYE